MFFFDPVHSSSTKYRQVLNWREIVLSFVFFFFSEFNLEIIAGKKTSSNSEHTKVVGCAVYLWMITAYFLHIPRMNWRQQPHSPKLKRQTQSTKAINRELYRSSISINVTKCLFDNLETQFFHIAIFVFPNFFLIFELIKLSNKTTCIQFVEFAKRKQNHWNGQWQKTVCEIIFLAFYSVNLVV